ncbi:hypothetical protein J1614_005575 [Plenodomus biglobosus]|nr:hypothetical protein J1614_005575 [Plenodomus biglobosus]
MENNVSAMVATTLPLIPIELNLAMIEKSDDRLGKEEHVATDASTPRATTCTKVDLPVYYDSEPSSQPPQYINKPPTQSQFTSSLGSNIDTARQNAGSQRRHSAQATTVSAILAYPYDDLDAQRRVDRQKKTIRERWKAFKERNFSEYEKGTLAYGSAAEWNVQGGRLAGGQPTPYRRAERK